jgi:hypothetical protein
MTATAAYAQTLPVVDAAPNSLELGERCSSRAQCKNGVDCYAVNSMQIPSCGKYGSECTNDSQCATNRCSGVLCVVPLASESWLINQMTATAPPATMTSSSSSASASSTATLGPNLLGPKLPPVDAAADSLELGQSCSREGQCKNGARCYAVNNMQIPTCGNFGATCSDDSQCATNTCEANANGDKACSGFLASASWNIHQTTAAASSSAASASASAAVATTTTAAAAAATTIATAPAGSAASSGVSSRPAGYAAPTGSPISPPMPGHSGNATIIPYMGAASTPARLTGAGALIAGLAAYLL